MKNLGFWWFEEELKSVVKVDGIMYTLDGWTGKTFQFSRQILDLENRKVSHTLYCLTPDYLHMREDFDEELEEDDIVAYHVSLY